MIRGKKVDLVAPSMDYVKYYLRWFNDPDVTDLLGNIRFPLSEAKEREWIEQELSAPTDRRAFTVLTKKGKPIGNAAFIHIDYRNKHGVIGIAIGEKDFWNKGYGEDVIMTLLKFGFQELGLHKIELEVLSPNERAVACYKKCGFTLEGCEREHDFYRGRFVDCLRMGIIKNEWLALVKKRK